MKYLNEAGFGLSIILCALILHFFPYPENKVAGLGLERQWNQQDAALRTPVFSQCDSISAKNNTVFERLFIGWLGLDSSSEIARPCQLQVHHSQISRFELRTRWAFAINVSAGKDTSILSKQFKVETPRPLVFLPIAIFVLGLIFEIKFIGVGSVLLTYFFLLSGANLIQFVDLIARNAVLSVSINQSFLGAALIIFWLSIAKARTSANKAVALEDKPQETWINRLISTLFGFWNPIIYTLFGRVLVPNRSAMVLAFLDFQFIVTCLSLYLFTINFGNLKATLAESLLMPRYFSFAAIILYALHLWINPLRRQRIMWKLPNFWRALGFVVAIEVAKYFIPGLREFNSLSRFAIALVLSELVWPVAIPWKQSLKIALPWIGVFFLGIFITVHSVEMGVVDLILQLLNPRMHPRILYMFTFLAGIGLGFLTGSFSAAFYTLFTFMQSPQVPILKAALLDGVVAGLLISPLSLFNMLPAVQFNMSLKKLLLVRFESLGLPLLVGLVVYLVANMTHVTILQPVTFVFCMLIAVVWTLKRNAWNSRRHRSLLAQRSV